MLRAARAARLRRPCAAAAACRRRASASAAAAGFRACVVGAGPGGLYTAKYLLAALPGAHVDVVDALPTPFGLVRSGVAPDHQEVKNVAADFAAIFAAGAGGGAVRAAYLGGLAVGQPDALGRPPRVHVADLAPLYDAVVLAAGARADRSLGLPGEGALAGVPRAGPLIHDATPQGRKQRQQHHRGVAERQLRALVDVAQCVVGAARDVVMVGMALQVQQEPVGEPLRRVPRVPGQAPLVAPR
jgi:NADPH-dependent glutamate synthase beta subunit-like oxidoreductase